MYSISGSYLVPSLFIPYATPMMSPSSYNSLSSKGLILEWTTQWSKLFIYYLISSVNMHIMGYSYHFII